MPPANLRNPASSMRHAARACSSWPSCASRASRSANVPRRSARYRSAELHCQLSSSLALTKARAPASRSRARTAAVIAYSKNTAHLLRTPPWSRAGPRWWGWGREPAAHSQLSPPPSTRPDPAPQAVEWAAQMPSCEIPPVVVGPPEGWKPSSATELATSVAA